MPIRLGPIAVAPPADATATSLHIRPEGAHRFSYTKVLQETGEQIWRWPHETPLSARFKNKGQLLDVAA